MGIFLLQQPNVSFFFQKSVWTIRKCQYELTVYHIVTFESKCEKLRSKQKFTMYGHMYKYIHGYLHICTYVTIIHQGMNELYPWNLNGSRIILIKGKAFENVICVMTAILFRSPFFQCGSSLWPSDVIWKFISWSTLVQVMACCLTASSHYLNQC